MSIKPYSKFPESKVVWNFDIDRCDFGDKVQVSIWNDEDIGFEFSDGQGYLLTLSDLDEIVRRAKLFKHRLQVIK